MKLPTNRKLGLTLVECLVFISIWAAVGMSTMMAIQRAAVTRGRASQRANLALIAQSELEKVRAIPAAELSAGSFSRTETDWPPHTSCTVTLAPHSAKTWKVDVLVERQTAHETRPVRLVSYRRGAQ